MKKLKGYVNKTICSIAGVGVLVFGSMLDSRSYWQYLACGICVLIVLVYGIANGWIE